MTNLLLVGSVGIFTVLGYSASVESLPFEVTNGSAAFASPTNIPGVEVKGKSNALSGHVEVIRDPAGVVIQNMEASIPVKSLATGMKLRDEHMRKYIFTTEDGKEPDIHFTGDKAACTSTRANREFTCAITGSLSIRGIAREYRMNLIAKDASGSLQTFRATGDGIVKLSQYGITRPTQFGVTSADEVNLHLEFSGKQQAMSASTARNSQ